MPPYNQKYFNLLAGKNLKWKSLYNQVRFFIPLRYIQNDKSACHSEEGTTEESQRRQR